MQSPLHQRVVGTLAAANAGFGVLGRRNYVPYANESQLPQNCGEFTYNVIIIIIPRYHSEHCLQAQLLVSKQSKGRHTKQTSIHIWPCQVLTSTLRPKPAQERLQTEYLHNDGIVGGSECTRCTTTTYIIISNVLGINTHQ
jgi:hypothetical protein